MRINFEINKTYLNNLNLITTDSNKLIIQEELEFKKESLLKVSWKRRFCVVKTDQMYIFETSKGILFKFKKDRLNFLKVCKNYKHHKRLCTTKKKEYLNFT